MEHVIGGLFSARRRARIAFAAGVCAISLASQCAARTTSPPDRVLHARLEFPLIGTGKPTGLLASDLDGDGKSELLAISSSPPTLQILTGLSRVLLEAPEPRAIVIDDFALGPVWFGGRAPAAGSAKAEIVYASRSTSKLVVMDAHAAWRTKTDDEIVKTFEIVLPKRPRVLASGQGPDGKPLIAVITVDDQLLLVRAPDDIVKVQLEDQQATCAVFGNKGEDLCIGFQGSRKVVQYKLDAKLIPSKAWSMELPGLPRAMIEVDRPVPTLLVAGGDDALWPLIKGEPRTAPPRALDGGTIPFALLSGPLLGDASVVSIALEGQEAVIHQANATQPVRTYAGQHPRAGAIGDFDGDGLADLALANGDAQRISVLFAKKDAFDVASTSKCARQVHALACGDFDGDQKPDVVSISALEGTLSLSLNTGGKLADARVQGRADGGDCMRVADLDGDGANDILFAKRVSEASTVVDAWFGDGKGHLFQRAEVRPLQVGASVGDMIVYDFDGDGTLEVVAADPEMSRVYLFDVERVKDAGARLGHLRDITIESGPKRLALIDVEGDAKPEVAVALAGPGKTLGVAFLRVKKDEKGAVALELSHTLMSPTPITGIAVSDNDQNGLVDLVLLASKSDSDNQLQLYYQGQDRGFTMAEEVLPTGLRPFALRMVDVDGDSIRDIVCTAQNSHHVNIWLNGGGTPIHFARLADIGVGTGPLDLQVVDLDGDGQAEMVVANAFSGDISVVRVK